MKKLFTLVALLACFLGAKAEWVEDYSIDYSQKTAFPFFVMGYVPEWVDGVMTDYGAMYGYLTDADFEKGGDFTEVGMVGTYHKVQYTSAQWHQYFIADGIPTELDGAYTVTAMVKASEAVKINVNMGWGWGQGESTGASVQIGTEWAEVEWSYSGIGGTSCNLVAQPGGSTATIEWKWLKVKHNAKPQKPTEWIEQYAETDNFDAEKEWPAWALEKEGDINANWRGDRTAEIAAWALTMGRNFDDQCADFGQPADRARPFPADIELEEGTTNHVFAAHVTQIDKIDDDGSIAWSNQFWIQSPKTYKAGTQVRVKFRYKADNPAKVASQMHRINPSVYLNGNGVGELEFDKDWKTCEKIITWDAEGWSIAFNLTANNHDPNVYYFDDLSFAVMKLDEGYFVAGCNKDEGLDYDLDNAIQFDEVTGNDDYNYVATVGEKDAYVSEIMISTVRGNDAAFKANTLKLKDAIKNDPDEWNDYSEASLTKLPLPGVGIWKIYLDTNNKSMAFEMLEGKEKETFDVVTNPEVMVINAVAREDLMDSWDANKKELTVREEADNNTAEDSHGAGGEGHTGQTWDNQFFIVANRPLKKGEKTYIEFKYVAKTAASSGTSSQGAPGAWMGGGIGNVEFTTEEKTFTKDFEIGVDDMKSIAFDLAVIKDANEYTIKDVQWYLKDDGLDAGKTYENLINASGTENFFVKIGAGTNPYQYGTNPSGIENVNAKKAKTSTAIYNLAGQRVDNGFKGIVIKDGKKFVK